jgi:hypothetical protein
MMGHISAGRFSLVLAGGICLAVVGRQAGSVSAAVAGLLESSYTIHSRGLKVGELKTVCSFVPHNDKRALRFESVTRIDANLLVYAYRLQTREEAIVADEGTVRYERTSKENGDQAQVEGHLENGRFLLDIRENGKRRTVAVSRESYDYTTMECPEVRMKHEGEEMTLRLLDLETLSVVKRTYRWVATEEVEVDGRRIRCRVVDFEDPNKQCRRWIKPDEKGAVIARQDGKGKGGTYSLRIAHLKGAS